jgi:3-oxoadipyl-CoA thiolase
MLARSVYVVDAVRTPIGRYRGALAEVRPDDLAAHVLRAVLDRAPSLAGELGEVVFGATNQAGEDNRNIARMAVLLAGLPYEVPGVTVNRLCGSGLEAVNRAAMAIALGDAEVVVAGGVESMTRAPFSMPKAAEAFDRNPPPIYDTTIGWRYPNPKMAARFPLDSMGETAENVAQKYNVTREAQDAFAVESQKRATAAWAAGAYANEVVPVPLGSRGRKPAGEESFTKDESPRDDTTIEKLGKLQPVFRKGGSVTAGNSSPINDGAAAVLLASEDAVKRNNLKPLARIAAFAVAGVEPNTMGEGPIPATKKALARAGWKVNELDLIELNEAFAAQALACIRSLELDPARVNVNGGAIALGHPIGSSGARLVATLTHAMRARNAKRGLASLCIGVGQGISTLFEAV